MSDIEADADQLLLDQLKQRSLRYGNVPTEITQIALAAFSMRDFDADLATILRDSANEQLLGVRTTPANDIRLVDYSIGNGLLSIGLTADTLTGALNDRPERKVDLVSPPKRVVLDVDEFGDFSYAELPSGPFRLEIGVGQDRVVTDWLLAPRR
jgi:hypothetical protein